MDFVFLLEATQDRNRILDRGFRNEDGLKAPRQRGVLLDMLPVFVERGGADAVQLAARQRRLQQIGRVHRALRLSRTDQRVHLVDEQDDLALGGSDLGEHRLQPFLELATEFRAGNQRAHVERHQPLVAQAFGHVAIDDAQSETFRNGRLADARLADQHGIVLRAPRQHLHRAPDFLVAADDRIELAGACEFGQIARIFLERIIGVLRRRGIGRASLTQILDRRVETLRIDARILQDARGVGSLRHRQCQKQGFRRDEAVAGLLGDVLRGIEQTCRFRREIGLSGARAFHLRHLGEGRFDSLLRLFGPAAAGTN